MQSKKFTSRIDRTIIAFLACSLDSPYFEVDNFMNFFQYSVHYYFSALSTFKPVTKLSYGETQALSSNGRILKSGKAKFVNFDSNVKDSTGPLVLKDPADSKMGANNSQVPHSVRELFTDKSHNAKFSIVDLKYDCCKATTTYLGLTFEGTKGSYKRVTEYIGTNKSMLEVGDVLLSIDNNDVQQMSLCGMRSFLMRLLREKILYCENAILKEGKYTFKRRYLRLKFRRTSVNDAAAVPPPMINNSYEIPDQSTQNVTKLPGTSSSNKRKQHSPHKSETGSGESFEIIKKRKYSRQNAAPKMSEEEQKEAEFDEAESCNDDDVEDAKILERKLTLMNRIQPTCRIFWNEHPAEVLTINREQFALEVRWSSNKVNWIEIEPDRIQLQEDLVMSSRSTRH